MLGDELGHLIFNRVSIVVPWACVVDASLTIYCHGRNSKMSFIPLACLDLSRLVVPIISAWGACSLT